jgi:hypothetical protein
MRNRVFAIALGIPLLFGCSGTQSDTNIQRLLVGTWRLDQDTSKTIQNNSDGSYILQIARGGSNVVVAGTWQVEAGYIISRMTNAPSWYGPQDPDARRKAETNKVVSIDAHSMTFLSSQDGTTILTAHKQ